MSSTVPRVATLCEGNGLLASRVHSPYSSTSGEKFRREEGAVAVVFFLFGSFSFFYDCLWKCGKFHRQEPQGRVTNSFPNHTMVKRRHSDPTPAGNPTHAQMLSFEDSAIRVAACFWRGGQGE